MYISQVKSQAIHAYREKKLTVNSNKYLTLEHNVPHLMRSTGEDTRIKCAVYLQT